MMTGWLLAAALALAPEPAAPPVQSPAVVADVPAPPEQVLAIPASLRAALQERVISRSAPGEPRMRQTPLRTPHREGQVLNEEALPPPVE